MTVIDPKRVVPFKVGREQYHLYASNRAFRLIERETGLPMLEVLERLDRLDIQVMTVMVWALLHTHHPALTLDDVDGVIDAVGYERLAQLIQQALASALPATDEAADEGKAAASDGIGTATSAARSKPA